MANIDNLFNSQISRLEALTDSLLNICAKESKSEPEPQFDRCPYCGSPRITECIDRWACNDCSMEWELDGYFRSIE